MSNGGGAKGEGLDDNGGQSRSKTGSNLQDMVQCCLELGPARMVRVDQ